MSARVPTLHLIGEHGPFVVRERALLGRDGGCDVVLPDKSISRRHATVEWDGERWLVQDVGSANGVFLGGRRVSAAELQDGAELGIGNLVFRVQLGGGDVATAPTRAPDEDVDFDAPTVPRSVPPPPRSRPVVPPPAAPVAAPPAPRPAAPPPRAVATPAPPPTPAFGDDDADADLPSAQPLLSVESLAEPVRQPPARVTAAAAPAAAGGPSLLFLAWLVPNVLIAALALYFMLAAQKSRGDLAAIDAEAEKVAAERAQHVSAGAALAEGAPESLVLCNPGTAPVQLGWIGALYRQGDESIRNFNSDYCPDQKWPVLPPGGEVRFRSDRERPAECRWDGSKPLVLAWRRAGEPTGFRLARVADLQGRCVDVSK